MSHTIEDITIILHPDTVNITKGSICIVPQNRRTIISIIPKFTHYRGIMSTIAISLNKEQIKELLIYLKGE